MLSPFKLGNYAYLGRVVNDSQYANEKKLVVKTTKSKDIKKLEQELRDVPSEDPEWRNKVMSLKAQIVEERSKNNLSIIKYDKKHLNDLNEFTLGLFRSVITDGTKILSIAPPKSVQVSAFKENADIVNYEFQEFVEGTMINMFYNSEKEEWEIATRSNIGARCKFYQDGPKTFRTMFLETMNELKYEFSMFNKKYSYSWVLQHMENRIVVPFAKSNLILTNIYDCNHTEPGNIMEIHINPLNETQYWNPGDPDIKLTTPKSLEKVVDCVGKTIDELEELFAQNDINYSIMGAIIYDKHSGRRIKIRNPTYEHVRQLKGNSPKLQFQYYKLRQMGLVNEFLKYYPENSLMFLKFRNQVHTWTNSLYQNYINCYIKKAKPLKEFPFEYRTHMFRLHRHYLDDLKPSNKFVNRFEVIESVNKIPCEHLMGSINYPLRKPKLDNIKNVIAQK